MLEDGVAHAAVREVVGDNGSVIASGGIARIGGWWRRQFQVHQSRLRVILHLPPFNVLDLFQPLLRLPDVHLLRDGEVQQLVQAGRRLAVLLGLHVELIEELFGDEALLARLARIGAVESGVVGRVEMADVRHVLFDLVIVGRIAVRRMLHNQIRRLMSDADVHRIVQLDVLQ